MTEINIDEMVRPTTSAPSSPSDRESDWWALRGRSIASHEGPN